MGPDTEAMEVYEAAAQRMVREAMEGVNGTVFAYGQTGSGKTYTMRSVMGHAAADIFRSIERTPGKEFVLRLCAMEIYNEEVWDLQKLERLRLVEDNVVDLQETGVTSHLHLMELLQAVDRARKVRCTTSNASSSRSHLIVQLRIDSRAVGPGSVAGASAASETAGALSISTESGDGGPGDGGPGEVTVAVLNFVDLAGSELAGRNEGVGRKEGIYINTSLLHLGKVMRELQELSKRQKRGPVTGHVHISYRNSSLTRILKPALGGNARTAVICTVSPTQRTAEDTRATLNFADRAKEVTTAPRVNKVLNSQTLIQGLNSEIAALRSQLAEQHDALARQELAEAQSKEAAHQAEIAEVRRQKERLQKHLRNLENLILRGVPGAGGMRGAAASPLVAGSAPASPVRSAVSSGPDQNKAHSTLSGGVCFKPNDDGDEVQGGAPRTPRAWGMGMMTPHRGGMVTPRTGRKGGVTPRNVGVNASLFDLLLSPAVRRRTNAMHVSAESGVAAGVGASRKLDLDPAPGCLQLSPLPPMQDCPVFSPSPLPGPAAGSPEGSVRELGSPSGPGASEHSLGGGMGGPVSASRSPSLASSRSSTPGEASDARAGDSLDASEVVVDVRTSADDGETSADASLDEKDLERVKNLEAEVRFMRASSLIKRRDSAMRQSTTSALGDRGEGASPGPPHGEAGSPSPGAGGSPAAAAAPSDRSDADAASEARRAAEAEVDQRLGLMEKELRRMEDDCAAGSVDLEKIKDVNAYRQVLSSVRDEAAAQRNAASAMDELMAKLSAAPSFPAPPVISRAASPFGLSGDGEDGAARRPGHRRVLSSALPGAPAAPLSRQASGGSALSVVAGPPPPAAGAPSPAADLPSPSPPRGVSVFNPFPPPGAGHRRGASLSPSPSPSPSPLGSKPGAFPPMRARTVDARAKQPGGDGNLAPRSPSAPTSPMSSGAFAPGALTIFGARGQELADRVNGNLGASNASVSVRGGLAEGRAPGVTSSQAGPARPERPVGGALTRSGSHSLRVRSEALSKAGSDAGSPAGSAASGPRAGDKENTPPATPTGGAGGATRFPRAGDVGLSMAMGSPVDAAGAAAAAATGGDGTARGGGAQWHCRQSLAGIEEAGEADEDAAGSRPPTVDLDAELRGPGPLAPRDPNGPPTGTPGGGAKARAAHRFSRSVPDGLAALRDAEAASPALVASNTPPGRADPAADPGAEDALVRQWEEEVWVQAHQYYSRLHDDFRTSLERDFMTVKACIDERAQRIQDLEGQKMALIRRVLQGEEREARLGRKLQRTEDAYKHQVRETRGQLKEALEALQHARTVAVEASDRARRLEEERLRKEQAACEPLAGNPWETPADDDTWAAEPTERNLMPRIMRLWDDLHVPLVHRARFVLSFRGRETFYFEGEHRRLEWMVSRLDPGSGARTRDLKAAQKELVRARRELREERQWLAQRLGELEPSREGREELYEEFGVPLEAKGRKRALTGRMWTPLTIQTYEDLSRQCVMTLTLYGEEEGENVEETAFRADLVRPGRRGLAKRLVSGIAGLAWTPSHAA